MPSVDTLDLTEMKPILAKYASEGRTGLIPALLEAQAQYGYLSEPILVAISEILGVSLAEIHGVTEFYTMLYREPVGKTIIRVCTSPLCAQLGSKQILEALCKKLDVAAEGTTSDGTYTLEEVPCLCLCDAAPAALVGDTPVGKISREDPLTWVENPQALPLGEIGGEPRWKTGRCGVNAPTELDAYQASGGYQGLTRALKEMKPGEVVDEIKSSGLVGRGGAAFPTGLKWEFAASTDEETRYIVCNGDESEPGTFKDRVLMEGDPLSILEGMAIAGYAIGARQGYIYIRGEYPRAQRIVQKAIEVARQGGFLGENILGEDFSFDVELRSGAGAYVCGEETALFESMEGKRGFPRLKPPYPTTHGLFGKPTVINNVETLCDVTRIVAKGVEAYKTLGTEDSPGTKLFCVSGDVAKPGVYETAFGVKLKDLIDLAGGPHGGVQAVLLGGAAGTLAGPDELAIEMSFEGLKRAGHALGSGVVMVINQERDLPGFLKSLAEFFAHESCGKCFPCRLGTQRQLEIMKKVAAGESQKADLTSLRDIAFAMTHASICGLGMTAGTAILSALDRWPDMFLDGKKVPH